MSNSPLVSYTQLSPNHSGARTHKIDTITIHCMVGKLSLKTLGNMCASPLTKKSCNYGVDDLGDIGLYVEEKNRSWCSSSNANDQRAITIEVASETKPPYKISDAAMKGLIKLCADVCERNDIKELLWKGDKSLIGQVDKQNMSVHRWFAKKDCPGDYLYGRMGDIATSVNNVIIVKKPLPIFQPYTVKIKVQSAYYRSGPNKKYPVVGTVRRDQVFTIIEEALGLGASKWGKLKSGAGWISLDDCTRMR